MAAHHRSLAAIQRGHKMEETTVWMVMGVIAGVIVIGILIVLNVYFGGGTQNNLDLLFGIIKK